MLQSLRSPCNAENVPLSCIFIFIVYSMWYRTLVKPEWYRTYTPLPIFQQYFPNVYMCNTDSSYYLYRALLMLLFCHKLYNHNQHNTTQYIFSTFSRRKGIQFVPFKHILCFLTLWIEYINKILSPCCQFCYIR